MRDTSQGGRLSNRKTKTTVVSKDSKADWVDRYVASGYSLFRLNGKHPVKEAKNWQNTPYDPTLDVSDFPNNYGVVLKPDDLVIDADPRNFAKCVDGKLVTAYKGQPLTGPCKSLTPEDLNLQEGETDNPVQRFLKAAGLPPKPRTLIVRTGGGGLHIYFKKPAGFPNFMLLKDYPGIEIKSQGHFLVGPGSIHPDTRKDYAILRLSPEDIAEAPTELLNIVQREESLKGVEGLDEARDDDGSQHRYITYLKNTQPAIEGCQGDLTTYKTAAMGRDFGLSAEVTYELMLQYWNFRCQPSWKPDELRAKVKNAYNYSQGKLGSLHPELDFDEAVFDKGDSLAEKEAAHLKWELVNGKAKSNDLCNTINYFLNASFEKYFNPLYRLLRYNEFSDQIEFNFPAPWHSPDSQQRTWTDTDASQLRYWLSVEKHYLTTTTLCHEAAVVLASTFYRHHPVKTYLNGLKWDGVKRLDYLLVDYAGATDTPYARAVGKNVMIAAVARIFEPGCQFDHILILEGKQGTGKSTFVRVLGGPWYKDIVIDPHNKDTIDAMKGGWVIEASEMEFARRADVQALKAFITRVSDFVRPAYARTTRDFPRQSIIIGTTNPDAGGAYLRDTTGNRRFWPIATGKIHVSKLREDRDQLWAEAVSRYHSGELYHLTDPEIIRMAEAEQAERTVEDSWVEVIGHWMHKGISDGTLPEKVTSTMVGYDALNLTARQMDKATQTRIASAMLELGWEKGKFHIPSIGKTANGFRRTIDSLEGL